MAIASNSKHKPTNSKLSIQISLSGLSFSVLDMGSNTITHLFEVDKGRTLTPFETLDVLKTTIEQEPILQTKFKSVNLIYNNELSTVVPKALFSQDHLADYLKFNSKILRTDLIDYDALDSLGMIVVYVPLVNINNFVYDIYGEFTFKHFSTVFIEAVLGNETLSKDRQMLVNVEHKQFQLMVVNNGELELYNSFNYASKEDFIYYILFTTEQLQLDPEVFKLTLLGNINEDHELHSIVYKYIKNVVFLEHDHTHKVKAETPNHAHFVLLNSF